MIDPVIFTIGKLSVHWYGVIIAIAVMIGAFLAERQIARRGGHSEFVWDLIIVVVPAGIIGARLWYVLNDMAGGSTYYTEDPARMFRVWEGGLHIYGAVLFGVLAAWWYAKRRNFDFLLLLDSLAPTLSLIHI